MTKTNSMKKRIFFLILTLTIKTVCSQTTINMIKKNGVFYIPCKVNGLDMEFIFDTGASDVSISLTEALYMHKHGQLKDEQIFGKQNYSDATGKISSGTKIIINEIEVAGIKINNVSASVVNSLNAPLLLGQSAIKKFKTFSVNYSTSTLTLGSDNSQLVKINNSNNENNNSSTDNYAPLKNLIDIQGFRILNPRIESLTSFAKWDLKTFQQYAENLSKSTNSGYTNKGYEKNCDWYGTGANLKDAVATIEKCSDGMFNMTWTDFKTKSSIMKDLSIQLENYFVGKSESGASIYKLKYEELLYEFYLHRNDGSEMIFVKAVK